MTNTPSPPAANSSSLLKVMIVDDEVEFCDLLAEHLRHRLNAKMICSNDGRTAFQLMVTERPDVIISDIRMPDGDGIELLERLRRLKLEKSPVVILTTGYPDIELDVVIDEGADAFFLKPFEIDALVTCVQEALLPLQEKWKMPRRLVGTKKAYHLQITKDDAPVTLGRGGCFVPFKGSFPNVDTQISYSIAIDAENTLKGFGIVRWVRRISLGDPSKPLLPTGFGLEFKELTDDSRAFLTKYLQQNTLKSYIPRQN